MKAVVVAFNQEKALVGAFSVIIQPVVEPMDRFTALVKIAELLHALAAPCQVSRCVPTLAFGHSLVTLHPGNFYTQADKYIQTIFNKWYVIYFISYQSLPACILLTVYHSALPFHVQFDGGRKFTTVQCAAQNSNK